nr:MAG TPA: KilA-N domain [Caudoviricetes sp.]
MTNKTITAKGINIRTTLGINENDYISITDIAKYASGEPNDVIKNWMRNKDVIEFLGLWEQLHNPNFKPVEFDGFKTRAGANAFTMSPKRWIEATNAIGIQSKSGRYGGTYAHTDIAFEFASWVSPEFKLYLIKDYQRLKANESSQQNLEWNARRELAKTNYRIHTDAIKLHIIPSLPEKVAHFTYASEADVLNVALFGKTAAQWRKENPDKKNMNIRDEASILELIVLVNLENLNAQYIADGIPQNERLQKLHDIAVQQIKLLSGNYNVQKIERN